MLYLRYVRYRLLCRLFRWPPRSYEKWLYYEAGRACNK